MNEQLLPCPFCGGKAQLIEQSVQDPLGRPRVDCSVCRGGFDYLDDKETLTRLWNTRFRSGKRPQIVNLELEDLGDIVQADTKTEAYIEKLENANSCYLSSIEANRERIKALHKENNHLRSLLIEAWRRFKQYEMDVDDNRPDHHIQFMESVEEALGVKK